LAAGVMISSPPPPRKKTKKSELSFIFFSPSKSETRVSFLYSVEYVQQKPKGKARQNEHERAILNVLCSPSNSELIDYQAKLRHKADAFNPCTAKHEQTCRRHSSPGSFNNLTRNKPALQLPRIFGCAHFVFF